MSHTLLITLLTIGTASALFAQSDKQCQLVGGTVSTNFLDPSTTFGTATGDLAGAIGVSILSLKQNGDGTLTFQNHHHWVITAGDTLQTANAYATGFPTPITGLFAAKYNDGIKITGGTGRFAGAVGHVDAYGAVDIQKGQVVLRYTGEVCLAASENR